MPCNYSILQKGESPTSLEVGDYFITQTKNHTHMFRYLGMVDGSPKVNSLGDCRSLRPDYIQKLFDEITREERWDDAYRKAMELGSTPNE